MTVAYLTLLVFAVLGYLILWREGLLRAKSALFLSAALLLLAMALRGAMLNHETLDYQNFLKGWVDFYRQHGGFAALDRSVGNYNVPYLYFLALFSYLPLRDLYLIKLLSVLFDLVLAWAVLRLIKRFRRGGWAALAGFLITLFLPTVLLNGAYWGQCDSIYAAFALWSVAFVLEGKPVRGMIAIALSFAFKLQAIFLMPVFLVFLFAGKIKWYHLPLFPAAYLLVVLPCVLAGRPLWDTVSLYFNQANTVGSALNYNSSSAFAFFQNPENPDLLAKLGILAAFLFLALVFALCFVRRKRLTDRALLSCCLLIALGVPFLLPHMHDRYFFLADVLSLALAVAEWRLCPVPVLVSFGSLLGYHAYLKGRFLLPMRYGAAALSLALLILLADLLLATAPGQKK